MVVNGNPLMRQGIDKGDLRGKGGVEQVPEAEPKRLCDDSNDLGISAQIDRPGDNCVLLAWLINNDVSDRSPRVRTP